MKRLITLTLVTALYSAFALSSHASSNEGHVYADGRQALGFIGGKSIAFPKVNDSFYVNLFFIPAKGTIVVPCKYESFSGETNTVNNLEDAQVYLTNNLFLARINYRFRRGFEATEWQQLEIDTKTGISKGKIQAPSYPCFLEFNSECNYSDFQAWRYVDYSGSWKNMHIKVKLANTIGQIRYEGNSVYIQRAVPDENGTSIDELYYPYDGWRRCCADSTYFQRASMCTEPQWCAIRKYESNMQDLVVTEKSETATERTMSGSASDYVPSNLGYEITNLKSDGEYVWFSFRTECPPPYEIGIFRMSDIALDRSVAIACTTNDLKSMTFKCNLTGINFFAQVGSVGSLGVTRTYTEQENQQYYQYVHQHSSDKSDLIGNDFTADEHLFTLCGNKTWRAFIPSMSERITLDYTGRRLVPGEGQSNIYGMNVITQNWYDAQGALHYGEKIGQVFRELTCPEHRELGGETYTNYVQQVITYPAETLVFPSGVASVGSGYRIEFNENDSSLSYKRAYSSYDDKSDEKIYRRPFKPLSAVVLKNKDGIESTYFYKIDWEGIPYLQRTTNAVPGKVYLEGIKE